MTDDYTPTTEEVRGWYGHRNGARLHNLRLTKSLSEFDRWLADRDAALIEKVRDRIMPPYNFELRPDGSEDPAAANYAGVMHEVHGEMTRIAQQIREGKTA